MNKKLLELQKKTREQNKQLVKTWEKVLDHKSMPPIENEWTRINTARIMESMRKYLNETTFSGDVAQFSPILIPMVRRVLPGLIANELVGVQPMPGPVSYVFGLRYGYAGENKTSPNAHSHYLDQGRIFKFRKGDALKNITGVLTGGGTPLFAGYNKVYESVNAWNTLSSNDPAYNMQTPVGFNQHRIGVGDLIVAVTSATFAAPGDATFTGGTIAGAWKVISIMDDPQYHIFLTVAFPIGTLEHSETWQQRFKLRDDTYDLQRNQDYKNGFYRRSVWSEMNNVFSLANTDLYFCRNLASKDPFRFRYGNDERSATYNSPPYDIYATNLSISDLQIIADQGSTYGPLCPVIDAGVPLPKIKTTDGISLVEYIHPAEVGYNKIFQAYSGPYETHVGEMLGVNQMRRKLGLYVEKQAIEARTRWLQASYSIEAEQDLRSMHNIDINSEFMNALAYEIGQEVDREILARMFYLAEMNDTNTLYDSYVHINKDNVNEYIRAGYWDGVSGNEGDTFGAGRLVDSYRRLLNVVLKMSNGIGKDTMRGNANFMVVSPNVAVGLEAIQNFHGTNITGDVNGNDFGVGMVGTINGSIKVYKDLLTERDRDFILLGYKGEGNYDSGIFYNPYIPLQVEQTQGEQTYERNIGFQTRYDISDNLFGAELYYRLIEIDPVVLERL